MHPARKAFFDLLDRAREDNANAGDERGLTALAEAAGLDPKTVRHYFPPAPGKASRPRRLPHLEQLDKLLDAMALYRGGGVDATLAKRDLHRALDAAWKSHGSFAGSGAPPEPTAPPVRPPAADVRAIAAFAPAQLVGRDAELAILDAAWTAVAAGAEQRPRVVVFFALGGGGKTALVSRWAVDRTLEDAAAPLDAFAWSFYAQGTGDRVATSSYEFLNAALKHFGLDGGADPPRTDMARAGRLAEFLAAHPALLVLDGAEPLQFAPGPALDARLKDDALSHLLTSLARRNAGLCVVTTRFAIADLEPAGPARAAQHRLPPLAPPQAVLLLCSLHWGSPPHRYELRGTPEEFADLARWSQGHALTLSLIGHLLLLAHQGDLRQLDRVNLRQADALAAASAGQAGHASRVLEAYVRWFEQDGSDDGRQGLALLKALALFDHRAPVEALQAVFAVPPIAGLAIAAFAAPLAIDLACKRLEAVGLATGIRADELGQRLVAIDVHPLVREFFAERLRSGQPRTWKAAHARLFEHLAASGSDAGEAQGASSLEPLYQAVVHGCRAGLHQRAFDEVYWARICRGAAQYSTSRFGAMNSDLAALACFFDRVWDEPACALDAASQTKVASLVAFRLRSAGRFDEALPLMQRALAHFESRGDADAAAKEAGNLSVLHMLAGRLHDSLAAADRSIRFAERRLEQVRARSANAGRRLGREEADARVLMANRLATRGDPLIQLGGERLGEALEAFRRAERIQTEVRPDRPLLHSTKGYRFHELLLDLGHADEVLQRTDIVSRWPTPDYEWLDRGQIATVRARAHLLRSRQRGQAAVEIERAREAIEQALEALRQANYQEAIARALVIQAEILSDADGLGPELVETLDLAWSHAQRGPLALAQVDILLARVRAHLDARTRAGGLAYPWESPARDLERARAMIEAMDYGRRRADLQALGARLAGTGSGDGR